ncbi:PP2C family protein-serine/threonine phosphatase [Mycobacterium asiaticum]|uniref:Histidine kinase n=1 Tax=Mycobacterium asiaticum TaxID=1790 RepID=A0A1A3MQQ0_MYCAS|nr:SpoIIE family protein phosphatase [Mycobacterium asiaticum]OBK12258.1 histidine kinase [Mycobacterium asiaticum]
MTGYRPEGFFDKAPCGLVCATPDRRILAVNRTLTEWLGIPADELIGRRFTELFSAGARIHYETHFAPLLQVNGTVAEMAMDLVKADETRLPALITLNVEAGDNGSPEVVRLAIHDARKRRSYERELLDERRRAEAERSRAQLLASTLQRSLLPPLLSPPSWLQAASHYHAASDDVGGDFYDLYPLSTDTWGFFLGDVAGKGASAAVVTSLTRYTLRAAAVMNADPVSVLHTLNSVLGQHLPGDASAFATVIVGTLRPTEHGVDVHLASGGHPPALRLDSSGTASEISTAGGQAVGMLSKPEFVATRFVLGPGDTMLLYTDGLTEARIGTGPQRYDDDYALRRFAQIHAPSSASGIIVSLRELLAELGPGVEDDVALLALGVPV